MDREPSMATAADTADVAIPAASAAPKGKRGSKHKAAPAAKPAKAEPITPPVATGVEFHSTTAAVTRAFARLKLVADHKSTLPILGYALVRKGETTTITATDLDSYLTIEIDHGDGASGVACINVRKAHEMLRAMPEGGIRVARTAKGMSLASGRVTAAMETLPGQDYPKVPSVDGLTWYSVDPVSFGEMLDQTEFSACQDETRSHLAGVLLECDGNITTMVSTDGHRLTKARRVLAGPVLSKGIIVRHKAIRVLRNLIKPFPSSPMSVAFSEGMFYVRQGDWTLATKEIDAQFPPYEQVIPKDTDRELVTVNREAFTQALKRCKVATSYTHGVTFRSDGSGAVRISGQTADIGEMAEEIDGDHTLRRDHPIVIEFCPQYMLELLGRIDDERVTLSFGAELDPIVVRSTSDAVTLALPYSTLIGVIMPMRL